MFPAPKLTLDLHPLFDQGDRIDEALDAALAEAEQRDARELEIIHGKGSGALKTRVLRYLDRRDVRARYHRVIKDPFNAGYVVVRFADPSDG